LRSDVFHSLERYLELSLLGCGEIEPRTREREAGSKLVAADRGGEREGSAVTVTPVIWSVSKEIIQFTLFWDVVAGTAQTSLRRPRGTIYP